MQNNLILKKKSFQSKLEKISYEEKHVNLLLIREKGRKHYVLIKDFNSLMYDHTLHRWKKHFCCYLQAFSTKDISKHHIKD